MKITPVIVYTTRTPYNGEENGKEYYFISEKEAQRLLTSQTIVYYEEDNSGNKFFITKQMIDNKDFNICEVNPENLRTIIEDCKFARKFTILCVKNVFHYYKFEESMLATIIDLFKTHYGINTYIIDNEDDKLYDSIAASYPIIQDTYSDEMMYLVIGNSNVDKPIVINELMRKFNNNNQGDNLDA